MSFISPGFTRFLWRTPIGRGAIERLREFPPSKEWAAKNSGYGVPFANFEDARSAPAHKPIGYEKCPPDVYTMFTSTLIPGDYPAMFWLQQLMPGCSRLFDYGGNIGTQYHCYSRYMRIPEEITWTVCDIDPFVTEGKRLAMERKVSQLRFCYDFPEGSGADIFLVSGSLHYLESDFGDQLKQLDEPPKHLLINRVPLIDGPDTTTLQDIGTALLPVVLRNKDRFRSSIEAAGYHLRDQWDVPGLQCVLPLYPDRSAHSYSGFYFTKKD